MPKRKGSGAEFDTAGEELPALRLTAVTVVSRKGLAALIEWVDNAGALRRSVVPADTIEADGEGREAHAQPDSGVPWGLAWESIIRLKATPAEVARELRARGVWTAEDARAYPDRVLAAIAAAHALDYQALSAAIEKESDNG